MERYEMFLREIHCRSNVTWPDFKQSQTFVKSPKANMISCQNLSAVSHCFTGSVDEPPLFSSFLQKHKYLWVLLPKFRAAFLANLFFSIRPTHWFGSLTRIPSPYKMISNILNLNQKGNFKNFDHFHREYIFAVPPVFAAPEPLRVLRRAQRDPPVPWESTQCAAQCPGRAHSTVPVHFGRAAADRQSTLPGPFLTCVVSHCCLIGKYFDLSNASMPF